MGNGKIKKRKAVFLDRDGVLNKNVFYSDTKEWESPRIPEEFELIDGAIEALKKLIQAGYLLFVVTNQPSFAKGKTSLENLENILADFKKILVTNYVLITKIYCSFNHPQSIHPNYAKNCEYRKPNIGALLEAKEEFNLDLKSSWIIGDRATDMECGKNAGTKTIFVTPDYETKKIICSQADFNALNITEAVDIILSA